MTRTEERKRAAELKAVDARELIKTQLSSVLNQLTATQVDQLQRVLDVAAIDAAIDLRGEQLDSQSIKGRIIHSSQYLRDPAIVAQRNKVLQQKITLKPGENAIRLDLRKLLTTDALKTTSDNPDEAAYLLVVAEVYERRGVWLVLDSSAGAMTQQMSPTDPRKWRIRLLLGYKPGAVVEEIKTANGSLDRSALFSVTRLGAGYYEWVHRGPTMRALKTALDRVESQITTGRNEHFWWSRHRDEFRVVSRVSDIAGRADWPSENIWDQPHKVYVQALNSINAGKLNESLKFALLAAYQAEWCARAVQEYVSATTTGASRVVTIIEVVQVCAEVVGWILSLLAVGQGVLRLLSRKGGQAALEAGMTRRQLPAAGQSSSSSVPTVPRPAPPEPVKPVKPGTGTITNASEAGSVRVQPVRAVQDMRISMNQVRERLGMPYVTEPGQFALAQEAQFEKHLTEYLDFVKKEFQALKARNPKWVYRMPRRSSIGPTRNLAAGCRATNSARTFAPCSEGRRVEIPAKGDWPAQRSKFGACCLRLSTKRAGSGGKASRPLLTLPSPLSARANSKRKTVLWTMQCMILSRQENNNGWL